MHLTRRSFLSSAIAASSVAAGTGEWERREFPDWPPELVEKLLTDSPWARVSSVPFEYRGLGSAAPGVRTEVYLTIRWSSALPIRQALALERWGQDKVNDAAAGEGLSDGPKEHLIEVFGLPAIMATNGAKRVETDLSKSARLWLKGRLPLPNTSAQVPEYGLHLSAALRFPRVEGISPRDETVELTGETGPIRIAQKFKLREMVYRGRLEW